MLKLTTFALALALLPACAAPPHTRDPSMTEASNGSRQEVVRIVTNIADFIDHKRWTDLRGLYADTVHTDYTSLFGGEVQTQSGDALIATWKRLLNPIVTQHLEGPIAVEVHGDRATARCHVRGYHYLKGAAGGDEWMVAGHWVIGLAKTAAGWRIDAMKLETFYQTGNTQLLQVASAPPTG